MQYAIFPMLDVPGFEHITLPTRRELFIVSFKPEVIPEAPPAPPTREEIIQSLGPEPIEVESIPEKMRKIVEPPAGPIDFWSNVPLEVKKQLETSK